MTPYKLSTPVKWSIFAFGVITLIWFASLWYALNQSERLERDAISSFGLVSLWTINSDPFTSISWGETPRKSFVCTAVEHSANGNCGFDITLGDGKGVGVDLSEYDQLTLSFNYSEDEQNFRIGYRNSVWVGDQLYQVQYENIVKISNGFNAITVPFNKLSVPEWWMSNNKVSEQRWGADNRENVTHIGFNINNPIKQGVHEVSNISLFVQEKGGRFERLNILVFSSGLYLILLGLFLWFMLTNLRLRTPSNVEEGVKEVLRVQQESFNLNSLTDIEPDQTKLYEIPSGLLRKDIVLQSKVFTEKRNFTDSLSVMVIEFYNLKDITMDDKARSKLDEIFIRLSLIVKGALGANECAIRWSDYQIAVVTSNKKESALKKKVQVLFHDLSGQGYSAIDLDSHLRYSVRVVEQNESIVQAIDSTL